MIARKSEFPSVAIIVLHWKGDWTQACLLSLQNLDYPNFQIILMDNGCRDQSIAELHEQFPHITMLRSSENRGFSGGNNIAIRWALESDFDYVWLLNNDTQVFAETLTEMVTVGEHNPSSGAIGSVLYEMVCPNQIQAYGGGSVSPLGTPRHYLERPPNGKVDYICGASLLLRSQTLEQVGLLDENYFLYWEDVDLCYRIRVGGWELRVAEHSRVLHQGSASTIAHSPSWDYDFTLSSVRFYRKFHKCYWLAVLWTLARTSAGRLVQGHFRNLPSLFRAVYDGLSRRQL